MVVASGRGYGTALLASLVNSVVAIESDAALARAAAETLKSLGFANFALESGPLEAGAPSQAPYNVILIEGAIQHIPSAILDQLDEGGRLGTVIVGAAGVLGVAQLIVKAGGVTSGRPLFDAGTSALPGFAPPPKFVF